MSNPADRLIRSAGSGMTLRRLLVAVAVAFAPALGQAGERELTFQMVTRAIDVKTEKVAEIDGQLVSTGRYAGTVVFTDGRIANKEFTFSFDLRKGAGPFYGYSTYMFLDGSTVVARFEGTLEAGKSMRGQYTILSGTGIYQGATGNGYFEKVDDPWEKANLYKGAMKISTP